MDQPTATIFGANVPMLSTREPRQTHSPAAGEGRLDPRPHPGFRGRRRVPVRVSAVAGLLINIGKATAAENDPASVVG